MKRILLSTLAVAALATSATASTSSELKALKAQMAQMAKKIAELESKQAKSEEMIDAKKKVTPFFAKASKVQFSGRHYIGFVHSNVNGVKSDDFETRRNYLQVKAYLFDDPKSYMRVTLDTHQVKGNVPNAGDWEVRLKYAYLYLNDVLPYTGVEFGQAHRPWIDYEEHHGWWYRSIAKTFVEKKQDADFTNSADLGINFKTKTEYFSSELGLFNGEGYHGILDTDAQNGLSFEWRLTANLLGTGKKHVHKHDTYADLSFYGQYNNDYAKKGDPVSGDFIWYGINAVYNQPEFLIAANYLKADEANSNYKGDGYSVNGELRLLAFDPSLEKWNLLARYDNWQLDSGRERETTIAGLSYILNKNVEFIVNYEKDKDSRIPPTDAKKVLFTADVKW